MEYSKIISITGLPGLFELVSTKSDGGIVRSLDDKSTRFVSSRVHQFSHLESIEVYTVKHNVNLITILQAMDSSKEKLPDEKDNAELRKYFDKVYPELDFDRVYSSDLKKMVKWFAGLKKNDIELKLSEAAAEESEQEEPEQEEPVAKKEEKAAPPKPVRAAVKEPEAKKPAKAVEVKEKETKKEPAKKAAKPKEKEAVKAKAVKKEEKKPAAKKTAKEEKPKAAAKGKSKKK